MNTPRVAVLVFMCALMSVFLWKTARSKVSEKQDKKVKIFSVAKGQLIEVEKVVRDKEEWRKLLTREQFAVTREHGTERPFSGQLLKNKGSGVYTCAACGTDLFLSEAKFDSGTGWPSFWKPVAPENVGTRSDQTLFMQRIEVHCPRCGAHLGHVFDDGPPPTHLRYCINSAALRFQPEADLKKGAP